MKISLSTQGSTEWMLERAGVVTASEVDALVSPTFEVRKGEGPKTYLYKKASERLLGYIAEDVNGSSFAMQNGQLLEKVAIPWYDFKYGVEIRRVGFVKSDDGKIGCSPDGLIGDKCGIEIKCPGAPKHLRYLLDHRVPPEYVVQVQFSMFVTGFPEWVFVSYHPHLPPFVVHAIRAPEAMTAFEQALADFIPKLDDAEDRVRKMLAIQMGQQGRGP